MKAVHKYRLEVDMDGIATVLMPAEAEVAYFGMQPSDLGQDLPFLWAVVDPDEIQSETRHFLIASTGRSWEGTWLKTAQAPPYVWHLIELDADA